MATINKNIWNKVVSEMSTDIPADEFALVVQEIQFESSAGSVVNLSVGSEFLRDRIMSLYIDSITKKLENYTNEDDASIAINIDVTQATKSATATSNPTPVFVPTHRDATAHPQLNTRYTFDNFVIGDNNRYAASAALAIAKSPGTDYNPFLIYGGVGLGKTHLIQSVGSGVFKSFKKMKIISVTAEAFTNEFIQAIREKKTTKFKNKYRYADLLLIDDIHFLQKKQETQEEIFHTFNALYDAKKQMIFTCDRPIREIKDITDRLRNRFERGLTVDLQPPSYETRMAILYKKIEDINRSKNISFSNEVLEYIAEKVLSNVRDLEAALLRLIGYTELLNKNITLSIAKEQLKDIVTGDAGAITNISLEHIQRVVANYFNISRNDLIGKKRTRMVIFPRYLSIHISRKITNFSFTEIGMEFGRRDHTTIMYACEQIQKRLQMDPSLEKTIQLLISRISSAWKS